MTTDGKVLSMYGESPARNKPGQSAARRAHHNRESIKDSLRCLHSGKSCGKETYVLGAPCRCRNCQQWLDAALRNAAYEAEELREEVQRRQEILKWIYDEVRSLPGPTPLSLEDCLQHIEVVCGVGPFSRDM